MKNFLNPFIAIIAIITLLNSACKKDVIDVREAAGRVVIDSLTASAGPADSYFEVFGNNFNYRKEDVKAYIGNTPLIVAEASLKRLLLHIPSGATTGQLRFVFNRHYNDPAVDFGGQLDSAVTAGNFIIDNAIVPTPVITALSTDSARANDAVTITGYNFFNNFGTEVSIGVNKATITSITSTQIKITVPSGAKPGTTQLVVKQGGKVSLPKVFEVLESLSLKAVFFTTTKGIGKAYTASDGTVVQEILYEGSDVINPSGLIVDNTRNLIYWINQDAFEIMKGSTDGKMPATRVYTFADGLGFGFDLALNEATNTLYITNYDMNSGNTSILKGDLDHPANGLTTLYDLGPAVLPFGLRLNIQTGKLYWTELINTEVVEANADGTGTPRTLYRGFSPNLTTIALDATHGHLFILDTQNAIYAAKLDGTGTPSPIITKPQASLQITNDIKFDEKGGFLYWFDTKNDITTLYRCKPDGSGVEVVFGSIPFGRLLALQLN